MLIPFFRTGTHTDSAGLTHVITMDDLDARASAYNEQQAHEAPVVVGHPKTDAPAYGWVRRLVRSGDTLVAEVESVADEFADWLERGFYKKVSAAFYPDGLLRHIGFLGAQPPAVKGLPAFSFAAAGVEIEFASRDFTGAGFADWSDYAMSTMRRIASRLRDWIIEQKGIEEADKVISTWDIDALMPAPESTSQFSNFGGTMKDSNTPPAGAPAGAPATQANPELESRLAAEQAARAAAEERIKSLESQFAEAQAAAVRARVTSFFAESAVRERVTAETDRQALTPVIEILLGQAEIEFAEADGKKAKRQPAEILMNFIRSLKPQVEFGERVTGGAGAPATEGEVEAALKAAQAFNSKR